MNEKHFDIQKAAAIIIKDRKAILTRSKGKDVFVPPGGKLEANETDEQACVRELKEELQIDVSENDLEHLGTFYADAAGSSGVALKMVALMVREYSGEITPSSEIEEITSVGANIPEDMKTGSIFLHDILPRLKEMNLVD